MIEDITIRDLGVIKSASLRLTPGFTAVTGETGAGKTMVVSALGLLLGERADSGAVRHDAERAQVEGSFAVRDHELSSKVEEIGGVLDGQELLIARTISAEGRSRVTLGGAAAPVGLLSEIGAKLVAIHGQSDQLRLRSATAQREALDLFAGTELKRTLNEYRELFRSWSEDTLKRSELKQSAETRRREAEELREAVATIDAASPVAGEDETIKAQVERLSNSEDLRKASREAHESLSAEDSEFDAISRLQTARNALERVAGIDPKIESVITLITEATIAVNEAAAAVSGYAAGLENEGLDLEQLHERQAVISGLMRRFGPTLDDVLALWNSASDRLFELDRTDDSIAALDEKIKDQERNLDRLATDLTEQRLHAAERLSESVSGELHALAMPTARFVAAVTTGQQFLAHGRDQVEMLLQANPGGEPKPITKAASGGELSRVMLALEVVIAATDTVPTLVFDEVDAGVGGASAIEIGRRLAMLSRTAQVIVVTHLPQVAAYASNHLRIVKDVSGDVTESTVKPLFGEDRVDEMARLLSGTPDSENARAHAQEMLDSANAWRGEVLN